MRQPGSLVLLHQLVNQALLHRHVNQALPHRHVNQALPHRHASQALLHRIVSQELLHRLVSRQELLHGHHQTCRPVPDQIIPLQQVHPAPEAAEATVVAELQEEVIVAAELPEEVLVVAEAEAGDDDQLFPFSKISEIKKRLSENDASFSY